MPNGRVLELQNSVCKLVVHGARNQPGERSWIIVEIHLPDILGEPHNTLFIFQRAHHRFRRANGIRQEGKPFWMVPLRLMLFRHVNYHNGAVHRRMPSKRISFGVRSDCGLLVHGSAVSSILVCHLPKSAKQMLVVEFADLEIGSAAERYRPSMAKYLPKPLCALYRGDRARAVNGLTSSNAAIDEIKRQRHEKSDFGHTFPLCKLLTPGGIAGDLNRRGALRFLVCCARSPSGWGTPSSWSSTAPRSRISNQPPHASQLKKWSVYVNGPLPPEHRFATSTVGGFLCTNSKKQRRSSPCHLIGNLLGITANRAFKISELSSFCSGTPRSKAPSGTLALRSMMPSQSRKRSMS
jgi:hypothetical protein